MHENDYKLILTDGTEIQFAAGSSVGDFIGIYNTFAEVDYVRGKMTEENLNGATFNGKVLENLIPEYIDVMRVKNGENIEVHFVYSTKSMISILQDQVTELQKALAEIVG